MQELEKVIASSKLLMLQYEITFEALKAALEVAKKNKGKYRLQQYFQTPFFY